MMGVNKTRYKSLDKLAADPRIVEVWDGFASKRDMSVSFGGSGASS